MKRLIVLLLWFILFCSASTAQAEMPYMTNEELEIEAQRGLGEILDLWRDGRYDYLYERSITIRTMSKESFIKRLSAAPYKPACCWQKMQDVKVMVKDNKTVTVRVKLGIESASGGTEFSTRQLKLVKAEGVWNAYMSDILSIAGESKKKSTKYLHHKKAVIK